MRLALGMIVKDEFDLVKNIVDRYSQYFDEIVLAVDKDIDKFKTLPVKVVPYTWQNDFSHKRNFLASQIESEYYFRLDCDDEIKHPERIREVFNRMVENDDDVIYFPYNYSKDQDNNCNALHWRETIIKKKPGIYWKKKVHENIFADDVSTYRGGRSKDIAIIHNLTEEHAKASADRNFKYLIDEYEKDGEDTDPRTLSYIGRVLCSRGNYKEAVHFLELLIQKGGWDDDKYFAWVHLAECWIKLGNLEQAIGCCNEALEINTEFPDAWIKKGGIYIEKGQYQKALDWIIPGLVRPIPETMFVVDPSFYKVAGRAYACIALMGKGDFEKAFKIYKELEQVAPNSDFVKTRGAEITQYYEANKYVVSVLQMANFIGAYKDKVKNLIESIPDTFLKDERIWHLRNTYLTPKKWSDKSVVIFCAATPEDWAPPSTITGIGGSEEAVIYLSKELVKQGMEVTVYNQCGDFAGTYDGVVYKNFHEINFRDEFNYFISWRFNLFRQVKIKAKKNILWLHDIPIGLDKDNAAAFDKVVVLSQFHKSLLPKNVREDQIFVSANGINIPDFTGSQIRNPKRMIYTSSYDRGVEHLLKMWPEIRKEVPDAELHLFYGWNTFNQMLKSGAVHPEFKEYMTQLIKQDGVTDHGRVGHRQLIKEFQKSGLWVYPCHFEEISCISAMKAQSCGCVPVCTDYAALSETVKEGIIINGKGGFINEEYKKALIEILKNEKRQEEIREKVLDHKEEFSWSLVAQQWINELFVSEEVLV